MPGNSRMFLKSARDLGLLGNPEIVQPLELDRLAVFMGYSHRA